MEKDAFMLIGSIQGLIFPLALVKPIFELVENFLNRKLMTISKMLKGAERLFKSFEKKCTVRFLVFDMFSFTRIFLDVGESKLKFSQRLLDKCHSDGCYTAHAQHLIHLEC